MTDARTAKRPAGPRPGARRDELLKVAARVFARKGFANATVRDIGEEAGILSGSLYHHFESKDSILEDLLVNLFDEMEKGYERVLVLDVSADEAFVELVSTGFSYLDLYTDEIHVLNNDLAYISHVDRFGFVETRTRRIEECWIEVLRRGIAEGVFREDIDLQLSYRITMGSLVAAVRWVQPDGPLTTEQLGRRVAEFYLDGLRTP